MSVPNEDSVASLKSCVLNESRSLLCTTLDAKLHFPYLRSKYIINQDDIELIELQQLSKLKVDKFIDILIQRGQRGFDELVKSIIKERTQIFLAEKLNKSYEEKKKRLEAILKDNSSHPAHVEKRIDSDTSLTTSGPMEHCNSPEPLADPPELDSPVKPVQTAVLYTRDDHVLPYRNSVSDLGVDTEKLPKPVMPKQISKSQEKEGVTLKLNGFDSHGDSCDNEKSGESILTLDEASA